LLGAALSIGLMVLTYRFIERPSALWAKASRGPARVPAFASEQEGAR
jgi:peptidoglycan/LPS O-acetylase OafA/YrhL